YSPDMDATIVLRIALAFVVAGIWIRAATLAGERLGTRIGGLIANLPSNILVSLLFISMTRGKEYAIAAAGSVPIGMAVDTIFLLVVIAALKKGLKLALPLGITIWAAAAALFLALPPLGVAAGILLYAVVCAASFAVAEWGLGIKAVEKKSSPFRLSVMATRAFFAGSIVAGVVAVSHFAPPYMTGILATFPAVLLSTLVILTRAQGEDFARATGKVLILSSSNIIVYSTAAMVFFPIIGAGWGTVAAFALAVLYVSIFLPILRKIR
ncbi:MAG: DUF3147 family protein, partial [Spirochaetaceae bacterium]|nr:DUF3147 family protein [Spirochaetaceae bacterium]